MWLWATGYGSKGTLGTFLGSGYLHIVVFCKARLYHWVFTQISCPTKAQTTKGFEAIPGVCPSMVAFAVRGDRSYLMPLRSCLQKVQCWAVGGFGGLDFWGLFVFLHELVFDH